MKSFTKRFFGRKFIVKPDSNKINKVMSEYKEGVCSVPITTPLPPTRGGSDWNGTGVRKAAHSQQVISCNVHSHFWNHKGRLNMYNIPNQAVESLSKADYYRTAIEEYQPDVIFVQVDPITYHCEFNKSKRELELLDKHKNVTEEDVNELCDTLLPNNYPKSINDLIVDYKKADYYLEEFLTKQREYLKDIDPEDLDVANTKIKEHFADPSYSGYEFEEIYYHSLKPQMIDKIEDYKEAFREIVVNKDIRKHPKMKELKKIHDILEMSRKFLVGGMISHNYHDMLNHLMRSLINRSTVVLGDFPQPLYHKYLDSVVPYSKIVQINHEIMEKLKDPKYDEIRGKQNVSSMTNMAVLLDYPQFFVRPKSLYIASVLKELLEQNKNIVAFVGSLNYKEVREQLKDKIYYKRLNLSKFLDPKSRTSKESNIEKTKKQAIIDNLLDCYPWVENHILNPFCYINEDPNVFSINELNSLKSEYLQCFLKHNDEKKKILKYEKNEIENIQEALNRQTTDKRKQKLEKARQM